MDKKQSEEVKQIISEINAILEKHERFMTISDADVFFALKSLKKARSYLENALHQYEVLHGGS
jgi:ElaB/YqjD/DUF883 family membrane-anchored ribosome-binding protein